MYKPEIILVMGRDFYEFNGNLEPGPETIRLLDAMLKYTTNREPKPVICFAAPVPPYGDTQQTLAAAMADHVRSRSEHDCREVLAEHFDSRGEIAVFWEFIIQQGIDNFSQITIIAADFHIPRLKRIVRQECGATGLRVIMFEPVPCWVSTMALGKEWVKRYGHVHLSPQLARGVARSLRAIGLNTSY